MKRKTFISILLCFILIVSSFTGITYADKSSIERDMKILASKEFMGRLVGTEGNEKAIDYVTDRFSEIGLEAFDEDYHHVCKQTIYDPEKQIHCLEVIFQNGNTKQYEYGKDFCDRMAIKEVDISAPITFDKNDQDMDKKIMVIGENDKLFDYNNKCQAVFQKTNSFFKVAIVRSKGTPNIEISEKLYNTLLSEKVKEVKLITKHISHEVDIKQPVGKISGKDHKKLLVLSAHMDHSGWAGKTIFYGAVDNAAGTSTIIDIAEKLKKQSEKKPFNMDILICASNGEDSMLTNLDDLLNELKSEYDEIYDINIDTIGKKDGGMICLNGDKEQNKELIEDLMKCFSKNNYEVLDEYYGASDHVIFNNQGFCGITVGQKDVFGENNTTSIHTEEDTLHIIDYDQLYKVSDIIYDFIVTNDGKIYKPDNK